MATKTPTKQDEILGAIGRTQDLQRETLEALRAITHGDKLEVRYVIVMTGSGGAHFAALQPGGRMVWTDHPDRATRFRDPQSAAIMLEKRRRRFPENTFTLLKVL